MLLPHPELAVTEMMAEFDLWVTASLGEISDTVKFQEALTETCLVMDILDEATNGFADPATTTPAAIGQAIAQHLTHTPAAEQKEILQALGSLLFLVTGKSDNNGKCQFPLYLRDSLKVTTLPTPSAKGAVPRAIPRVVSSDGFMGLVAAFSAEPERQAELLQMFLDFILSGSHSADQLWALGSSYHVLRAVDKHRDLLSPLVIFQVRGSVSASGGHDPERVLRSQMASWGLVTTVDFNTADVEIGQFLGVPAIGKARKFDFALPYRTEGWQPRVLIQCQFYAGDSGSVSHKNVDQTPTGRGVAREVFNEKALAAPVFVEYVDGAGYFASLNGDLRHLLQMDSTKSFVQIRSAPIRLRRELQQIGFLTPLEVQHALLRTSFDIAQAVELLRGEGYADAEIERLKQVLEESIPPERRQIARRYLLLDLCAMHGEQLKAGLLAGTLLCPGYGPLYGLKLDTLSEIAIAAAPVLKEDWNTPAEFLHDVRWLCEQGFASLA